MDGTSKYVRRVRWLWRSTHESKTFDTHALKQGDTTQKLGDGPVRESGCASLSSRPKILRRHSPPCRRSPRRTRSG